MVSLPSPPAPAPPPPPDEEDAECDEDDEEKKEKGLEVSALALACAASASLISCLSRSVVACTFIMRTALGSVRPPAERAAGSVPGCLRDLSVKKRTASARVIPSGA